MCTSIAGKLSSYCNFINHTHTNTCLLLRYTELDVQGKYIAIREAVGQYVRQAATIVNQTLLLCRLHETRICDPLLEPIIEDLINSDDGMYYCLTIINNNNFSDNIPCN